MNSTRLFGLVMALLYLASVTAFSPAAVSSANVHAASTAPARAHARANEYDTWWIDRRAHSRHEPEPAPAAGTLPLDNDNLALVLTEFVRSDYARQVFNYCSYGDVAELGQIDGMFDGVQLSGAKVVLKPKLSLSNRPGHGDRVGLRGRTRHLWTAQGCPSQGQGGLGLERIPGGCGSSWALLPPPLVRN